MKKIWVTADYHLGHHNIIRYCERPFKTIQEMDEAIISNHNNVVAKDDTVYFLGDFCFYKNPEDYIKLFNGQFFFVRGNHDKQAFFKPYPTSMSVLIDGKNFWMYHTPSIVVERGYQTLVGHVHEKWREQNGLINVGVDVWDFKPVDLMSL